MRRSSVIATSMLTLILACFVLTSTINAVLPEIPMPMEVVVALTGDPEATGYQNQRNVAIDPLTGNIVVTYRAKDVNKIYQIYVDIYDKYGKLISKTQISYGPIHQRVGALDISPDGTYRVAWHGALDSSKPDCRQIFSRTSTNQGGIWSTQTAVSSAQNCSYGNDFSDGLPAINNSIIAWEGPVAGNKHRQIKFATAIGGGATWTQEKVIQAFENNSQSRPVPLGGNEFMGYSSALRDGDFQQIMYINRVTSSSPWQNVSRQDMDCRHISAVKGPDGTIHGSYRGAIAGHFSKTYYLKKSSSLWEQRMVNPSGTAYEVFPNFGLANGVAVVTWTETPTDPGLYKEKLKAGTVYYGVQQPDGSFNRILVGSGVYSCFADQMTGPYMPILRTVQVAEKDYQVVLTLLPAPNAPVVVAPPQASPLPLAMLVEYPVIAMDLPADITTIEQSATITNVGGKTLTIYTSEVYRPGVNDSVTIQTPALSIEPGMSANWTIAIDKEVIGDSTVVGYRIVTFTLVTNDPNFPTATVTVTVHYFPPGDVNNDGRVDIVDLILVALGVLEYPSEYDLDVDGSGVVDNLDLAVVAMNFNLPLTKVDDRPGVSAAPPLAYDFTTVPDTKRRAVEGIIAVETNIPFPRDFWGEQKAAPMHAMLLQNFPNPFNPETWIPYQLIEDAEIRIRIYSASGQLVRTLDLGHTPAGFYEDKERAAYWDGRNEAGESISSGVYFYNITAGEFSATRKMIVKK